MKTSRVQYRMVALSIVTATSVLGAQTPRTSRPCIPGQWSAPQVLQIDGPAPFEITHPSLANGKRGELYIVGRGPVIESDSGPYLHVPFVALEVKANGMLKRLSAPSFTGEFYLPRAIVVNDTLRVFWGEPSAATTAPPKHTRYDNFVPVVRSIWTAAYTDHWSAPKRVTTGANMNWLEAQGGAKANWSSDISLAVAGLPANQWVLTWLDAHGTSSQAKPIDLGTVPLYTSLISPAPAHLVLGYIANDTSVHNDHNSVFAIRSTNNGQSWSTPVRIALSGQQIASDVTLVQTHDGVLHAIWARNTSGKMFATQVIGYAISRDTGQTWSAPDYWNTGTSFSNLRAVADGHHQIDVVYQGSLPDGVWPSVLYTSRTATTSWVRPRRVFGDTLSTRFPALIRTTSGDVALLYSQVVVKDLRSPVFKSTMSYLHFRASCRSSPS